MKAHIVVGANFGDEGKGLVTDYLADKFPKAIVVRHNGGAQAGHTVVCDKDGIRKRHVFNHIGSGYFADLNTYLAEEFVLNPILFSQETERLFREDNLRPYSIFVHPNCRITTVWDMLANQSSEENVNHGSCGVGVFQTILRHNDVPFTYEMLKEYSVEEIEKILNEIKELYKPILMPEAFHKDVSEKFLSDLIYFKNVTELKSYEYLKEYDDVIFEGAQGLLLDEHHDFFPHVTPSATGLINPWTIMHGLAGTPVDIEVYYVTRTYLTRHGAGPLPNHSSEMGYDDDTNLPHKYQGVLRFAPLDVDFLRETLQKEWRDFSNFTIVKNNLVVTHCDQTPIVRYFHDGTRKAFPVEIFLKSNDLKILPELRIFASFGPTRKDIKEIKNGKD